MARPYFEAGSHRIHARVWNDDVDAPTVVLVHGLVVSSRYMRKLGEELASTHRVFAVDLPGHGYSSKPKPYLTTEEQGLALTQFLTAAGIEQATVVSNSYGCSVAIEAALVDDGRIAQMVLIGPTGDVSAKHPLGMGLRFARGLLREPLWSTAAIVPDFLQCGPLRALHEGTAMCDYRIHERLRLVNAPVHLMRGEYDRVAPARWLQELSDHVGAGPVTTIAGAAHKPHAARPHETATVVRSLA